MQYALTNYNYKYGLWAWICHKAYDYAQYRENKNH